jgi:hypothetical protein
MQVKQKDIEAKANKKCAFKFKIPMQGRMFHQRFQFINSRVLQWLKKSSIIIFYQ